MRYQGLVLVALSILPAIAQQSKKAGTYQVGTYVLRTVAADGTTTNDINCGPTLASTTCSGGIHQNGFTVYEVQVEDGVWHLVTFQQASDSAARKIFNITPTHFKAEKPNPLDFLKAGDRVLFRVEKHKKLLGSETDVLIPFADNPNKEAKFIGSFHPTALPESPKRPSDNVKAMCDAHKLSPELEKQLCSQATEKK
jgi:hypothetical protein